jgi:CPA2 family monovalent cation:H+ antiporter-2
VLFFVSVGMLLDPTILVREPIPVLVTLLIIVLGKSLAAFGIVRGFGYSTPTALTISASLAQIGEFSFILAGLGVSLALLPEQGRDLILAGAIISILLNPLLFAALDRVLERRKQPRAETSETTETEAAREPIRPARLANHIVLVGHGRVGGAISMALREQAVPLFVIEDNDDAVAALKKAGIEALIGNAADPAIIAAANLTEARCLLVAIPDAFEGGQVVQQARSINPKLLIIARAHSEAEIEHFKEHGADLVVMGEHEIAKAMLDNVTERQPDVVASGRRPRRAGRARH